MIIKGTMKLEIKFIPKYLNTMEYLIGKNGINTKQNE